jgi:hypothetical protein
VLQLKDLKLFSLPNSEQKKVTTRNSQQKLSFRANLHQNSNRTESPLLICRPNPPRPIVMTHQCSRINSAKAWSWIITKQFQRLRIKPTA